MSQNNKTMCSFVCSIVVVGAVGTSTLGYAQEGGSKVRGNRLLEEVVVTAQKRVENAKDVPISLTAFSSDMLDAKVVLDVQDLPKITPGLHVNQTAGFTVTYLRGVGSDAFILGDPLVVTYIDDVYFPFSAGQISDFGAVESVEVLKGPQGTLFGRNALGGAIKTKTLDPSFTESELSIKYLGGSFDKRVLSARVSVPIMENLAIAISGQKNESENYRELLHTSSFVPVPKEQQDSWRVKLFYEPFSWMQVRANYYKLELDGASSMQTNTNPSLLGQALGITPEDPRKGGRNDHEIVKATDVTTVFGGFTFFTPWADVKILGSEQEVRDINTVDFDGSRQPIAAFVGQPGLADSTTAELQILSNEDTPFSERLRWIVGAYYFESTAGFDTAHLTVDATSLEFTGLDLDFLDSITDILDNVLPISLPVGKDLELEFIGLLYTESFAYYTQADFDFSEWFSMTLGMRYQQELREIKESSAAVANTTTGGSLMYQSYSVNDDPSLGDTSYNFDPKISLNAHPKWDWLGDDPLIYLSAQTATTSLTYNTINITNGPEKVKSTEIVAYEAGIKTKYFDGIVDFNAALFDYDITNPQVQLVSLLAGGAVSFENAESQRIKGAEYEMLVVLFPELLNNSLVFTSSGSYLDAVYTSYKNGSGYNAETGLFETGQDYTGNQVVRAPKYTYTLGLSYLFFTPWGPLETSVDYYYNDGYSYMAQGTENTSEDSYGTVGVNVNYLIESWNLRLVMFGRNITDEDYNLSKFTTDFGTFALPAPLANYGFQVKWDAAF